MDLAWVHWNSFWLGVLCAYAVPWIALLSVVGVCFAIRDARAARERRRLADALTDPGVAPAAVTAALGARQAQQDAQAVEALLRSLPREA